MTLIVANWSAPTWIKAYTTTRAQGCLKQPEHRLQLQQHFNLTQPIEWLQQDHGNTVITLEQATDRQCDGAFTQERNRVCAVLTADCLPLLLCNQSGTMVSAVHCGWRGIQRGIIENAVQKMQQFSKEPLLAWMGPAIGPDVYEVGAEVCDAFVQQSLQYERAFRWTKENKYLANLYLLAQIRLRELGVFEITGGEYCTYTQSTDFFSHRRSGEPGRMASVIWIGAN
jgi:YfiH family protein